MIKGSTKESSGYKTGTATIYFHDGGFVGRRLSGLPWGRPCKTQ